MVELTQPHHFQISSDLYVLYAKHTAIQLTMQEDVVSSIFHC